MEKGQEIKFIDYSFKIPKVNTGIYQGISKFSKDYIIVKLKGREYNIFKSQVINN